MTNEDYIIEILLKAEKLGIREQLLIETSKIQKVNSKLSLIDALEQIFKVLK